jgi:hypothetical protein
MLRAEPRIDVVREALEKAPEVCYLPLALGCPPLYFCLFTATPEVYEAIALFCSSQKDPQKPFHQFMVTANREIALIPANPFYSRVVCSFCAHDTEI